MSTSSANLAVENLAAGPERDLARGIARLAGRIGALLASHFTAPEGVIARAIDFLEQAAAHPIPGAPATGPLGRLIDAYGLGADDLDLLLLAGVADEHEGFADIFRTLHPRGEPRPTAGLAAQLLEQAGGSRARIRELLATGPAVASCAVQLTGDAPLFERDLVLAPGLWNRLHGVEAPPPGIELDGAPVTDSGLEDWLDEPETKRVLTGLRAGGPMTLVVAAHDARTAQRRAAVLAAAAGLPALRLLLPIAPELELIQRICVHAAAAGRVPVLRIPSAEGPTRTAVAVPAGFPAPVVLCCRSGSEPEVAERTLLRLAVERPATAALARMWQQLIPELAGSAAELAARFPLEPDQALRVVEDLQRLPGEVSDIKRVAAGVRARNLARLGGGIQLIRPCAGWDALVLPQQQLGQLQEAVERLRHQALVLDTWRFLEGRRGARGVRLLLSGPSGTGKTLSAEVLANALDVDLLLVDLSRVVSKWIGETEKNLAEVFEAAEQSRAVLLFDEADALFGSRTQVSDAHDRYANLETAYLLSRLERFDGLAALSTNLRQNIDSAFLRRLDFVVEYEEPGREQRLALWRCHLPEGAPRAPDLNLTEFAAYFPIVGGLIRNASLSAAFMAASEGTAIARHHMLRAIRREYEKAGKSYREPPGTLTSIAP